MATPTTCTCIECAQSAMIDRLRSSLMVAQDELGAMRHEAETYRELRRSAVVELETLRARVAELEADLARQDRAGEEDSRRMAAMREALSALYRYAATLEAFDPDPDERRDVRRSTWAKYAALATDAGLGWASPSVVKRVRDVLSIATDITEVRAALALLPADPGEKKA